MLDGYDVVVLVLAIAAVVAVAAGRAKARICRGPIGTVVDVVAFWSAMRRLSSAGPLLVTWITRVAVWPLIRSAWIRLGVTAMSGGAKVVAVTTFEIGDSLPNSSNAFRAK